MAKQVKRTGRSSGVVHGRASAPGRLPDAKKRPAARAERRKVFVYARDLRVGDVIDLHESRPAAGGWENVVIRGSVMSIKLDTLYSKALITLVDQAWPDTLSEHRLQDMSYIHLVSAPDGI